MKNLQEINKHFFHYFAWLEFSLYQPESGSDFRRLRREKRKKIVKARCASTSVGFGLLVGFWSDLYRARPLTAGPREIRTRFCARMVYIVWLTRTEVIIRAIDVLCGKTYLGLLFGVWKSIKGFWDTRTLVENSILLPLHHGQYFLVWSEQQKTCSTCATSWKKCVWGLQCEACHGLVWEGWHWQELAQDLESIRTFPLMSGWKSLQ